jgi:hypothetical protein
MNGKLTELGKKLLKDNPNFGLFVLNGMIGIDSGANDMSGLRQGMTLEEYEAWKETQDKESTIMDGAIVRFAFWLTVPRELLLGRKKGGKGLLINILLTRLKDCCVAMDRTLIESQQLERFMCHVKPGFWVTATEIVEELINVGVPRPTPVDDNIAHYLHVTEDELGYEVPVSDEVMNLSLCGLDISKSPLTEDVNYICTVCKLRDIAIRKESTPINRNEKGIWQWSKGQPKATR